MNKNFAPAAVLTDPQNESLIEEMKHWEIVEVDDKGNVKINVVNPNR